MGMKAQNRCCPLHQDTCDHCGFYDIGSGLCIYDDSISQDENGENLEARKQKTVDRIRRKIKEKTNGSTCKEV